MITTKQWIEVLVAQLYRSGITYRESVDQFRRAYLLTVLEDCNWNACKAARLLGMHRNTLSRTIQDLKLQRPAKPKKPARSEWGTARVGRVA